MARKVGQIIARGNSRWLIRVYLGRDHEMNKRNYHNRTIHGPMREAQAYQAGTAEAALWLSAFACAAEQTRTSGECAADLPVVPRGTTDDAAVEEKAVGAPCKRKTTAVRSNQEWAVGFTCDGLATGPGIRILAIVDGFTRECLT
jgi:hypothetical protein